MASPLRLLVWPISRKPCKLGGVYLDRRSFISKGSILVNFDYVGEARIPGRILLKLKSNVCGVVEEILVKRGDVVSKG